MSRIEKPSVLLVDDNEPTRTLITALLQREFDVHAVSDGQDAIDVLKTRSFAAVLLDLRMPQFDGFAVLEFLQDEVPDLVRRVIVVTAMVSKRDVDRAKAFGVHDIVQKPFDVEVLLATVRNCVGSDRRRFSDVLCASGPMLLLLADLLRQRLM